MPLPPQHEEAAEQHAPPQQLSEGLQGYWPESEQHTVAAPTHCPLHTNSSGELQPLGCAGGAGEGAARRKQFEDLSDGTLQEAEHSAASSGPQSTVVGTFEGSV